MMQVCGKLKLNKYYKSDCFEFDLTSNGEFCYQLHDWFIETKLKKSAWEELYVGPHPVSLIRFSINAVLWFGKDFEKFKGIVPGDDKEFLSCIYPSEIGKANCYNGDALLAHFAFNTQRKILDQKGILERYGEYLNSIWANNAKMDPIHNKIQQILRNINDNEEELMSLPSPYKRIYTPQFKLSIKVRLANVLMRHAPTLYGCIMNTFGKKPVTPDYIQ